MLCLITSTYTTTQQYNFVVTIRPVTVLLHSSNVLQIKRIFITKPLTSECMLWKFTASSTNYCKILLPNGPVTGHPLWGAWAPTWVPTLCVKRGPDLGRGTSVPKSARSSATVVALYAICGPSQRAKKPLC